MGSRRARQGDTVGPADIMLYLVRMLGKLAACSILILIIGRMFYAPWPQLRSHAVAVLVLLDYEKGNTCSSMDHRYGLKLEDDRRSVATIMNDQVIGLETLSCRAARVSVTYPENTTHS